MKRLTEMNWNQAVVTLIALGAATLSNLQSASALDMKPVLPTKLATKAAVEALKTCKNKGYSVTATVIEPNGTILATLREQEAGPHTIENSFNKAYTVSSFGRISGFTSSNQLINASKGKNAIGAFPLPAAPLYGLSYSNGGLSINSNGQLIGAIGVSGAKSGGIDNECAQAGLQAIQDNLN